MAERARVGTLLYPAVIGFLGLGSEVSRAAPGPFLTLLTVATLIAVGRMLLALRFETLYDRSPRFWDISFFGGLLVTCAGLGAMIYALILLHGPTPFSLFALAIGAWLAVMAIVVYSYAVGIVWAILALVALPAIAALAQVEDAYPGRWILGATVVAVAYLTWAARQQSRERWAALATRYQLQDSRQELESLVAERTRALERTIQTYRQIFESAHDPIIVFRPDDERVLNVNRRACEIYGFTREEFLQISLADISENVARGQQQIRDTLESGVYHNFESTQFRKDGSRMFLEINASAIEYEGQPAILSINRDVTERRRSEALRLAKEAAERAAQTKTQFLANMSHEIRTPMAGVIGLADLLLTTDLDRQQAEYARLIQSSALSLLRLIDDILDFSKIEAGKLAIEEVAFDLRSTLAQVIDLLRLAAAAQGTSLRLEVAEDLPDWVRGDPGRLRQVLVNLVGNAVKFTEAGTVTVRAAISADGRVRIEVEDNGIGIPYESQGRLFELFSQADDSTSRRYGGTGLGLAISHRIVEAMRGEIGFESSPGEGSTFWIALELPPAEPPAAEPAPAVAGRPGLARHILTAEDNAINQLVITEQLKALGHEVTAVSNGLEAVQAVKTGEFDLVLMDCQMPQLDGYEATLRIRRLPGAAGRIPIVALTAHAVQEELDKCLAVGMNDTITKPFREEVLRRKLERWLGPSGPPDGAGGEAAESALDLRQIDSLRAAAPDAGEDFLPKLIGLFRDRPYLDEMRRALDLGDRAVLRARAHGLKGTAAFLGAARLSGLCAELERLPLDAPAQECRDQLSRIEAEHGRVLRELEALTAATAAGENLEDQWPPTP